MRRHGFTIVEVVFVAGIIGILMAIGIPNYVRAKRLAEKNACIAKLKQIQSAVARWTVDTGCSATTVPTTEELVPDYIKNWPEENGAEYPVPSALETPTCPNLEDNPEHHL